MSLMRELLTQPQFRRAEVDGDTLVLTATLTDETGVRRSTLVWRRLGWPLR